MKTTIFIPLSLAMALTFLALNTISSSACSIRSNSLVTFYGYPDNDPPGPATAYNCGGRNSIAGGTGTYADPLTFASAQGEYNSCEIIYLPYLKKYLRYEDFCAQCTSDWARGKAHIDVWTGSSKVNGGQTQINCENALTPNNQGILRQPATNLPVDTTELFHNGKCNKGATYSNNKPSCGGASCSWAGHCEGAACGTDNDCSDALTCKNGHCADSAIELLGPQHHDSVLEVS